MAQALLPPAPNKFLEAERFPRGCFLGSWSEFCCLWGAFGRLLGGFGDHLGVFGWPVLVFCGASAGKRIHDNFFDHLGGSWFDFWCLWGPFGRLLGAFGGHLDVFGWPVAFFGGFLPENVKL